jgi:hypothetical protein
VTVSALAQYTYRNVADNTMMIPGGGTPFAFFPNARANASINNAGVVAFQATSLYRNDGITTTTIVQSGSAAPGGGTFVSLRNPVIGEGGHIAFTAQNSAGPTYGYYRVDPVSNAVRKIAATGDPAPGGGTYQTMDLGGFTPSINASGTVAYWGETIVGGFIASHIYVSDGTTASLIASKNDPLPGGGVVNKHDEPDINATGQIAYYATTTGGPARGVYLYDNLTGTTTRIAATGDAAPGGGNFNLLGTVSLNDAGDVAFHSSLLNGSTAGLYVSSGGSIDRIAAIGDPLLAGGPLARIWIWQTINNNGLVAFATYTGTSGVDFQLHGIYTGNGAATNKVIALGDILFGSLVTNIGLNKHSLNDLGQTVFNYTLADGRSGIAVASPQPISSAAPEPASLSLLALACLPLAGAAVYGRHSKHP